MKNIIILFLLFPLTIVSQTIEVTGKQYRSSSAPTHPGKLEKVKLKISLETGVYRQYGFFKFARQNSNADGSNKGTFKIFRRYPYFNKDKSREVFNLSGEYVFSSQKTDFLILKCKDQNKGCYYQDDFYQVGKLSVYRSENDFDEDGIVNSLDKCPYKPGPISNNGCPMVQPIKNPDLLLDANKSTSVIPNESVGATTQSLSNNHSQYMYLNSQLHLSLIVKNNGEGASGKTKIGIYLSKSNSFSDAKLIQKVAVNQINSKSAISKSLQLNYHDLTSVYGITGTAYLHLKMDNDNDEYEGTTGENNNIYSSRRITFVNAIKKPSLSEGLITVLNSKGMVMKKAVKITSEDDVKRVIKSLPKGKFYIHSDLGNKTIIKK